MKRKQIIICAGILFCLAFFLFWRTARRFQLRHVEEYLDEKYAGEQFEVRRDKSYFRVRPRGRENLTFTVHAGTKGAFYDDYPSQLLGWAADRLGLKWEAIEAKHVKKDIVLGGGAIVTYEDYGEIDAVAAKVEALLEECRSSGVFEADKWGALKAWTVEVRPAGREAEEFPGYKIEIVSRDMPEPQRPQALVGLGITRDESDTVPPDFKERLENSGEDLAGRLKIFHIYCVFNYMLPEEESPELPAEASQYEALCRGAVLVDSAGEENRYPMVETDPWGYIDFGGAYRILEGEGCRMEAGERQFTASSGSRIVTIFVTVKKGKLSYEWRYSGDGGLSWKSEYDKPRINSDVITRLTGKTIKTAFEEQ